MGGAWVEHAGGKTWYKKYTAEMAVICLQHIKDGRQSYQLIHNNDSFCIDFNTRGIWTYPQYLCPFHCVPVTWQNRHQQAKALIVSDLLYSHMGSMGHYMDFVLKCWQGKAFSHTFPQGKSTKFQGCRACVQDAWHWKNVISVSENTYHTCRSHSPVLCCCSCTSRLSWSDNAVQICLLFLGSGKAHL